MADYDESGNPIPPADAQAAREASLSTGEDSSDPTSPNYVSPDVVTILAPSMPSLLGLLLLIGAVWYFSAHSKEYFSDED